MKNTLKLIVSFVGLLYVFFGNEKVITTKCLPVALGVLLLLGYLSTYFKDYTITFFLSICAITFLYRNFPELFSSKKESFLFVEEKKPEMNTQNEESELNEQEVESIQNNIFDSSTYNTEVKLWKHGFGTQGIGGTRVPCSDTL